MRKFFVSITTCLLCSLALASQAAIIGFELETATTGGGPFVVPPANGGFPSPLPAPPIVVTNDFTSGIETNNDFNGPPGDFKSFLVPGYNNVGVLPNGSSYSFGVTQTFNNTGDAVFPDSEGFAAGTMANIGFYLTATDGATYETNFLILRGTLSGGFNQTSGTTSTSNAFFDPASLDVYTLAGAPIALGLPLGAPVLSPTNTPSYLFDLTPYYTLGQVNFFVDQHDQLTSPTGANLSVGGYLSSVPEPGSVALLIGMGAGSSLLALRRRRK